MAINVGYEVLFDSSTSAKDKSELTAQIIQALPSDRTLTTTYATTYAAGSGSTNQASLAVNGSSPDHGVRILMDSAVVGNDVVLQILALILRLFFNETVTLSHAAAYAAGTRTYNVTITIT